MRLLIVENEDSNRLLLEEMLELMYPDIEITSASNGIEAVKCIDEHAFDLIVTDIDMPEMNGYELFDAVRYEKNLDTPMVCITAYAVKGDRDKLLEHGFNDYLSKPINMNDFEALIEKYIIDK